MVRVRRYSVALRMHNSVGFMILWLNGPFGVGKTTLARALLGAHREWAIFDPEDIGFALRQTLETHRPVSNFQDWPVWRSLVIEALAQLDTTLQSVVIVPQTVLNESHWLELTQGLQDRSVHVSAFTLHVDEIEHEHRISTDAVEPGAASWRRDLRPQYADAQHWMTERTRVIDTTRLSIEEVLELVDDAIG